MISLVSVCICTESAIQYLTEKASVCVRNTVGTFFNSQLVNAEEQSVLWPICEYRLMQSLCLLT